MRRAVCRSYREACNEEPLFIRATSAASPPSCTISWGPMPGAGGPSAATVTWTATDGVGNSASTSATFQVVDTTPPVVTLATATNVLWSPNHEMVNVGLTATVTDGCDGSGAAASLQIEVYADEVELPDTGDGSGNHSKDVKNIAPGTLRLRSERRGTSDGRVYLIVGKATDAAGNVGFGFGTVVVPTSQNNSALAIVEAQASTALASVTAEGSTATTIPAVVASLLAQGWHKLGLAREAGPYQ
jgi:hypothetical protein